MVAFGGLISLASFLALAVSLILGAYNMSKKNGSKSGRIVALVAVIGVVVGFTISNMAEKHSEPNESKTSKIASSSSKKSSSNDSGSTDFDKQVKAGFKEIGGSKEYPAISRVEANTSNGNLKGISIWGDESLEDASSSELKHYFSAGAQIGNYVFAHDKDDDNDMKVPFVQVYAGNTKIARSDFSNNSQMKDLR